MKEIILKYGCNPDQSTAKIYMSNNSELPIEVLNGRPGYINFLDAMNSWQLVRELKNYIGLPSAASFKHVSPAGAAIGKKLSQTEKQIFFIDEKLDVNSSLIACAYARARGTDRLSSFGDWIALSDKCDEITAKLIEHEVSDGIIAPDYSKEALEILKRKRKGNYSIVKINPDYEPEIQEHREVFGITFEQSRNTAPVIEPEKFKNPVTQNKNIPDDAKNDLIIGLITLKYTQSNSVCCTFGGQTSGVGAGQQSRLHCVRLACNKSDLRLLREHPKILNYDFKKDLSRPERDNLIEELLLNEDFISLDERQDWLKNYKVSLSSDAFFPFPDSIERAQKSGVKFVAQPGGSIRDDLVIKACNDFNISMVMTGHRLFHH